MVIEKTGLVIVNTGDGKGKTTAALGMLMRSKGQELKALILQFVKSSDAGYGEIKTLQKLGIEWQALGDGCTWNSTDLEISAEMARKGWQLAREKILSGEYDLIILDELTHPMNFGWLDTEEVVKWLKTNKPSDLHLVITGRQAPQALIDYADLVTEMRCIKHPFTTRKLKAQKGVEF